MYGKRPAVLPGLKYGVQHVTYTPANATQADRRRCHRRGLSCQQSVPRRRNGVRKPVPRVSGLESRLDDLVSLLRAQQNGTKPGPVDPETPRPDEGLAQEVADDAADAIPVIRNQRGNVTEPALELRVEGSLPHYPSPLSNVATPPGPGDHLMPVSAEATLSIFRHQYLKYFPFTHIPAEVSAHQLQLQRPFLFLNIRAVCSQSQAETDRLGDRIRETLGSKFFVEQERNLDILQGLLVYLAWYDTPSNPRLNLASTF